jgi:glycerophosphoryl diester phosphodiesterase
VKRLPTASNQWQDTRVHRSVSSDRPLIFAHRGGAGLAPENTIPAFDNGLALGADGLELDVRLSRDGVPMVHHDPLLDRTTDASGPIGARDAAALSQVNAAAKFVRPGGLWSGGPASVPTLREVLLRYHDARLIVELKGPSRTLARAVVEEVGRARAWDRVCIGGFSWRALTEVRRREPRLPTSASQMEVRLALYASWVRLPVGPGGYAAFQVPQFAGGTRVVSPRFVRFAHQREISVQVWTVDAAEEIRRLLDWGVDAIITDRPDVAVPVLKAWLGAEPHAHAEQTTIVVR